MDRMGWKEKWDGVGVQMGWGETMGRLRADETCVGWVGMDGQDVVG